MLNFDKIASALEWPGWTDQKLAELSNLYHLAHTAVIRGTNHDRLVWAAARFAEANPQVSSTAAYKQLDRQRAWRFAGAPRRRRGRPNLKRRRKQLLSRYRQLDTEALQAEAIEDLDLAAFGVSPNQPQRVPIERLRIMRPGRVADLEGARHDLQRDPGGWLPYMDEPIEVHLRDGQWLIDDGHHRYLTALERGDATALVNVEVKDNPVVAIERQLRRSG